MASPENGVKLEHPLFDALRKLNLPIGSYAVFGSGPMFANGVRPFSDLDDIDILAIDDAWKIACDISSPVRAKMGYNDVVTLNDGLIEIFDGWSPGEWDSKKLINEADIIDGIPFVRLAEVVKWKKTMGREKDKGHLEMIYAKFPELKS
jgi:hypothetical protein